MSNPAVTISRDECERLIKQLKRAVGYCTNARSSFDPDVDLMGEPTDTYPGASGYACSTMKLAVQSLELHMLLTPLVE